jgi:hypothetical protein
MEMSETELYRRAARLAFVAMGKKQGRIGRSYTRPMLAHDDPLAHWKMTECIVALARKFALDKDAGE